jgi:site-specific DNA recombinase
VVRPGAKRGQIDATLHGELGTILSWTAGRGNDTGAQTKTPAASSATGVSVSVVAGIGFEPMTFRL